MSDLTQMQAEHREWAERNFGIGRPSWQPLLGALEELGELAHAHLKDVQGIRGTSDDHRAAKIDAVADVIIYLTDYCNLEDIDLRGAVLDTWTEVRARDWRADPTNGSAREGVA